MAADINSHTLTPGSPKPNTSVKPAQHTRGKSTLTSTCRDLHWYKLQKNQPAIDPISRSDPVLCSQLKLDANNGGSMGFESIKVLQVGTRLQACSTQATSTTHHERKGLRPHTNRDREDSHQRCTSFSGPLRRTIPEQNVSKEDGSSRPVVNLKALNKFITLKKFKIEGAHILRDPCAQGTGWHQSTKRMPTFLWPWLNKIGSCSSSVGRNRCTSSNACPSASAVPIKCLQSC